MGVTRDIRHALRVVIPAMNLAAAAAFAATTGWRTDGTGRYPEATPPLAWSATSNVVWQTALPPGNGTPVPCGDRVFVCAEPFTLICVKAADGAILWQRTNAVDVLMSEAELADRAVRQAAADALRAEMAPIEQSLKQQERALKDAPTNATVKAAVDGLKKQRDDLRRQVAAKEDAWYTRPPTHEVNGYATATPVCDGQYVYALFGNGVAACYDLQGVRRWIKFVERPSQGWGHSASPLLAQGKLICHVRQLNALDAATGSPVWQAPSGQRWGTPILARAGDVEVLVTAGGDVVRVSDGKVLASKLSSLDYCAPILNGDTVYFVQNGGKAIRLTAPEGDTMTPAVLWETKPVSNRYYASPLYHEGLIYAIVQGGALSVIDAATGAVVAEKKIELKGLAYPSLCLAGNAILAGSDGGSTVVIKPGKDAEVLGRNMLEGHRGSPVAAGDRLYLRGFKHLYCIGAAKPIVP